MVGTLMRCGHDDGADTFGKDIANASNCLDINDK